MHDANVSFNPWHLKHCTTNRLHQSPVSLSLQAKSGFSMKLAHPTVMYRLILRLIWFIDDEVARLPTISPTDFFDDFASGDVAGIVA